MWKTLKSISCPGKNVTIGWAIDDSDAVKEILRSCFLQAIAVEAIEISVQEGMF